MTGEVPPRSASARRSRTHGAVGVPPRKIRRRLIQVVGALSIVPVAAFGVSWYFTPELTPRTGPARPLSQGVPGRIADAKARTGSLDWPEASLDGEPAKKLLLDVLLAAREHLRAVPGYTATLRRRERVGGELGEPQTIAMKVRHEPFAVYLRFVEPEAGKEVVYDESRYDGDMMAHPGGFARAFLPVLKVPPDSAIALAGNRHPITEAGLLNLTEKLIGYRELDLLDPEADTILDRDTDPEGREYLRSVHTHPHRHDDRPFAYVEVLYDPGTKLPVRITNYDWPADGSTPDYSALDLAEQYFYEDLDLNAPLTDLDFDPANPAYEFRRF